MSESREGKIVLILRSEILHYSETFILEQVKKIKNWDAILLGKYKVENGLDLSSINYKIFPYIRDNILQRWSTKLRDILWIPNKYITSYINKLNPNIIHIHFGTDAVRYWPSIKNLNVPILITLHGYDINIHREWWESGQGGNFMKKYPQRLLEIAQQPNVHFIAVSNAIKNKAIECGIAEEKITVHYIGVDTTHFFPAGLPLIHRKKRILFVGRMVEKKAPLLLIKAFAKVVQSIPDVELVMVGDGPLKQQAECLVRELGITVSFTGALSSDEVLAHIHEARLFCLPSITAKNGDAEGFGLVILEAQACGVPVVTSALGGAQEGIKTGETGSAFTCNNLQELIDQLLFFLTLDDESLNKISEDAKMFIRQNFNASTLTVQLEYLYQKFTSYPL